MNCSVLSVFLLLQTIRGHEVRPAAKGNADGILLLIPGRTSSDRVCINRAAANAFAEPKKGLALP
jgi:hypothetical protein